MWIAAIAGISLTALEIEKRELVSLSLVVSLFPAGVLSPPTAKLFVSH